jgi:hypothetical protein
MIVYATCGGSNEIASPTLILILGSLTYLVSTMDLIIEFSIPKERRGSEIWHVRVGDM